MNIGRRIDQSPANGIADTLAQSGCKRPRATVDDEQKPLTGRATFGVERVGPLANHYHVIDWLMASRGVDDDCAGELRVFSSAEAKLAAHCSRPVVVLARCIEAEFDFAGFTRCHLHRFA